MNPETTLCWHPLRDSLNELRQSCLREGGVPPHWTRVENGAGSGMPDLSWSWLGREGHIELKHRGVPPVGEETPVTVDTITSEQRLWWRQRWESGGNVHVLLRLGQEFLLFPGRWAALNLGYTPLAGLRGHCGYRSDRRELSAAAVLRSSCR